MQISILSFLLVLHIIQAIDIHIRSSMYEIGMHVAKLCRVTGEDIIRMRIAFLDFARSRDANDSFSELWKSLAMSLSENSAARKYENG